MIRSASVFKGELRTLLLNSCDQITKIYQSLVWRYLVDPTETIERNRSLIIWKVDIVFLQKKDLKYEKNGAGTAGGGRAHTFDVIKPTKKLRGTAVYKRSGIIVRDEKPIPINGQE